MTTFWTILIITYSGLLDGSVSYVALPSQDACEEAMDLTYDLLYPQMPDLMLQCVETATLSGTIRPMPRPEDLKGADHD